MSLVQADSKEIIKVRSVALLGTQIYWDESIEKISQVYGNIVIDYAYYLFEERFIVGFERQSCSC